MWFRGISPENMTFVTDVAALRRLMGGEAAALELALAIDAMNAAMGITGEGGPPNHVAKLMVATCMAAAAPVAAPAAPAGEDYLYSGEDIDEYRSWVLLEPTVGGGEGDAMEAAV